MFPSVLQVFDLQRLRDDDLLLLPSDSRYRCAWVPGVACATPAHITAWQYSGLGNLLLPP